MLKTIASTLVLCFTFSTVYSQSVAQSPAELRPVSSKDFEVQHPALGNIKLTVFQSRINFKNNIEAKERRYYYAPFIALRSTNGALDVIVSDEPAGTKKRISIPIQWDRQDLAIIIREYLIANVGMDSNLLPGQIQAVGLKKLKFETAGAYNPKIQFDDLTNPERNSPFFTLTAVVDSQQIADRFVNDLRTGLVAIQAMYIFEGSSYQENTYELQFSEIESTRAYKNLNGANPRTVTREQVANISREALFNLGLRRQVEFTEEDFNKLAEMLTAFLVANNKQIRNGWSELAQEFINLGISPNDFRADLITRSQSKQNSTLHSIFSEKVKQIQKDDDTSFSLFTNFDDVLDLDYADKDKAREYTREVYSDVLKQYNVETSFEGQRFVPKSINIVRNDFSRLQAAGKVSFSSARFVGGDSARALLITKDTVTNNAITSVEERLSEITPVGTILPYAGKTAPKGWLLCDGAPIDVNRNPEHRFLAALLGTNFDQERRIIRLPDLRGRAPIGSGQGSELAQRELGAKIGSENITLTTRQLPKENYSFNQRLYYFQADVNPLLVSKSESNTLVSNNQHGRPGGELTVSNVGGGQAVPIMQPSLVVSYIIKY